MKHLIGLAFFLLAVRLAAQSVDTGFVAGINEHRRVYRQELISETRAPLTAKDTALLDFFAPDPAWRIPARFTATPDAQPFDLYTYSGLTRLYRQYGALQFEFSGQSFTLNIYQNLTLIGRDSSFRDYLFLPFNDATNGETTYGGGRYLDFRFHDIREGILMLDFNKCYNPYCAYSDGYNCPIPPKENHLAIEVKAGERMFRGEKRH